MQRFPWAGSAPGGLRVLSAQRPSQTWTVPAPSCTQAWLRILPCGARPRLAFPTMASPSGSGGLGRGGVVALSSLAWFLWFPVLDPFQIC